MGTLAGDHPSGATVTARPGGPTLSRLVLGMRLRGHRTARRFSRRQVADAVDVGEASIAMLERGRSSVDLYVVIALCGLYGIQDHAERAMLLGLARQSNTAGWWDPFRSVVPPWLELFLGLEQEAGVVRGYSAQFVPDLLQTPDYATAFFRSVHGDGPLAELRLRLELRMRRQEIIRQESPPHLWMVIDEAALRRRVGSRTTMYRQLEHLLDICELPRVTIQILPFTAGVHPATCGSIGLLCLPEPGLPDFVYLEQLASALYLDRIDEVSYYRHILNLLATRACLPGETPSILRRLLSEV